MKLRYTFLVVYFAFSFEVGADAYLKIDDKSYFSAEHMIEAYQDQFTSQEKKNSILNYIKETPGLWVQITKEFWKGLSSIEGCSPQVLLRGLNYCKDVPEAEWQKIFDEVIRQAYLAKPERNPLWPYLMEGGLLTMAEKKDSRTEALALHLLRRIKDDEHSTIYSRQITPALEKMGGPEALAYLDARWGKMLDETIPDPTRPPPPQMNPTAAAIRRRLRDEGKAVPPYRADSNDPHPDFKIDGQKVVMSDRYGWMAWFAALALGFGFSWFFRKRVHLRNSK